MQPTYYLRIKPTTGFGGINLAETWEFRGLLFALAIRDIKLRYRQTALGVTWVILQPLLASGVLAFVFGTIAGVTRPERSSVFIFVLGGFIGWMLFSATFTRANQSLLQHSMLISKVYFPRLILPVSAAASGLLDAGVGLAFFVLLRLLSGSSFGMEIVTLPVWLAMILMLALRLGSYRRSSFGPFSGCAIYHSGLYTTVALRQPCRLPGSSGPREMASIFFY